MSFLRSISLIFIVALFTSISVTLASTETVLWPWLVRYEEHFYEEELIDDDFDYVQGQIIQSPWLEWTIAVWWWGNAWLEMWPLVRGSTFEVIGPISIPDETYNFEYINFAGKKITDTAGITVQIVDKYGTILVDDLELIEWAKTFNLDEELEEVTQIFIRVNFYRAARREESPKLINMTVASWKQPDEWDAPRNEPNSPYWTHERQVMDFYRAPSKEEHTPFVLFAHGGAFSKWDKESIWNQTLFKAALQAWISVATMNYRLNDTVTYPDIMTDGWRAIQYTKFKNQDRSIDPNSVAVAWKSAWWYLLSWNANQDDQANVDSIDPIAQQSSRVDAILTYDTPTQPYDKDTTAELVWCDPSLWPWILNFFWLEITILPWPALDWTEYYTSSIQDNVLSHRVFDALDETDPAIYMVYYDGLLTEPHPPGDDCIHSPRQASEFVHYREDAWVDYKYFRGPWGDLPANLSTTEDEIEFLMSQFAL